ncbi:hypothetical protein H3C61_01790 [Candidatus Gracilibacteria bacterium]|nr:hypothetical protein [Candidatus Gracilibacteria bacterium]
MNLQKITFFTLFIIIGLFFILNVSFFGKRENISNFSIPEIKTGISLLNNENKLVETKDNNFNEKNIYIDYLNDLDKVYFSSKNYKKTILDNNINFELGNGSYIFDLYDLSNNFSINNNYFKITPKSPGSVLIEVSNSEIKIYSFSQVLNIGLLGNNKNQTTSLTIYPHTYFSINPSRNNYLQDADILRISSISKIIYIKDDLLTTSLDINKEFLNKINILNDKVKLVNYFINDNYISKKTDLFNLDNIVIYKNKDLFGIKYIEKYFSIFLNKGKKVAFYKKNILNNISLFFEKNKEINQLELSDEIIKDFKELKKIDLNEFNNFKKIFSYYYLSILKINDINFIDKVIIFAKINASINDFQNKEIEKSYFYLNKIYFLVDSKKEEKSFLQKNIITFLNSFLAENNIKLKEDNIDIKNSKDNNSKIEYLLFFLKNILTYDVDFSNRESIGKLLDTYKIYLITSNKIKENLNSQTQTETLLIEFSDIYTNFLKEIRDNLFKQNLNDDGLLVLSDIFINRDDLDKVKYIYDFINNFYTKNKGFLSSKNLGYNSIYFRNNNNFREYYLALSNYGDYSIQYNKLKSDLLNTNTILETNKEIILSRENLINYLKQFNGIDLSKITYTISPQKYYIVGNLIINNDKFGFELYPQELNLIKNIYKNNEKLSFSYELDSIKNDLKILYEDAEDKDKPKYDFRNFFLNTFYYKKEDNQNKYQVEQEDIGESKIVSIFKSNKLFGINGDFNILKGYLDIKYNDVKVEFLNNNYNIKIINSILNTNVLIGEDSKNILAKVRADYVFNDKDHYFKNIYITFYDRDLFNAGKEEKLFGGKEFRIFRNINILDFKTELNKEIISIYKNN